MEVTLTAASYRWRCPECEQEHFVSCITHYVSCPDCGCICKVARAEHRSRVDDGERGHRFVAQAALF
ncbi:MAG: hypothetical protein ACP5JJ_17210 [Anaerolineae bacterium]